jgi:hypothetical protein
VEGPVMINFADNNSINLQDILTIRSKSFNIESNFENISYDTGFFWEDEIFEDTTEETNTIILLLLLTRKYIHISGSVPKSYKKIWEFGLREIPEWNGFKRLTIKEEERDILINMEKIYSDSQSEY